jgi:hypothetical protein
MSIGSGMRMGPHRSASAYAARLGLDFGMTLMRVRVHATFGAAEKP